MPAWKHTPFGGDNAVYNKVLHTTGEKLKAAADQHNMTDISALGDMRWQPTRCPEGGPNNKLDTIMVSDTLVNQLKARVTHIIDPMAEPEHISISDHKMLIMRIKANCSVRTNLYSQTETYKLSKLLNSPHLQQQCRTQSNVLALTIRTKLDSTLHGTPIDVGEINQLIVN